MAITRILVKSHRSESDRFFNADDKCSSSSHTICGRWQKLLGL
jgi:hypothetical protein